jgi:hypothetical protein
MPNRGHIGIRHIFPPSRGEVTRNLVPQGADDVPLESQVKADVLGTCLGTVAHRPGIYGGPRSAGAGRNRMVRTRHVRVPITVGRARHPKKRLRCLPPDDMSGQAMNAAIVVGGWLTARVAWNAM